MSANKKPSDARGLRAAVERGAASKLVWVDSGEVIPTSALAAHWGLAPSTVGAIARRGEASFIFVFGKRFFPKEFLALERDIVREVSLALSGLEAEGMLLFWKRPHGALRGKTPLATIQEAGDAKARERVVKLAHSWTEGIKAAKRFTIGSKAVRTSKG